MVEIGGKPILWHIMRHYLRYGFDHFVIALGYKGEHIKRYMVDYSTYSEREPQRRHAQRRREGNEHR